MASPPSTDGSSPFELDLNRTVELICSRGARLVGLQVPEGLKRAASGIAKQIKDQTGAEVIISGDPCYGACDVDMALRDEVDIMLHLGHAELDETPEKVIFLEARMSQDPKEAVEKAIRLLRSKKVGVTTT